MSHHHKKTNHKKPLSSTSSTCSSENNLWQNTETSQSSASSSSGSSIKRPIYPNVPKRSQRSSFIDDHEIIETESRIDIIPSEKHSQNSNEYSSIGSSSNENTYTRYTLDLITKYTSPKKKLFQESDHRSLSPVQSQISINQSIHGSKFKRTLSPLDETNRQNYNSKRTKSFDDNDDDDEELSQFLDYRYNKQSLSQTNNTTMSSQSTTDGEQRKPTARKPTVRNLSTKQQKPTLSQPIPIEQSIEPLIIEVDHETEEENLISREAARWSSTGSQFSNNHQNQSDGINQPISIPIIPSPIKLPVDNCLDSSNSTDQQNLLFTPTKVHTPIRPSRQIRENLIDNSSPSSNNGRRFSTTSSNSLIFDTPNSSFSRMTINHSTSTPRNLMKTDQETEITYPTNLDMINQLISQINLNDTENKIDYNPKEIAKKFFHQCISFSNNTYQRMNLLIKKQSLHFGRYEIEVLIPSNPDKNPTIYACDVCLKHFYGSLIAYQRHIAKCLYTQPPGKLVFNKDDLAIFEIGETTMNMEQRIYMKSLCRIVRLFIDPNKSIDDTKIDRFTYYILCRRKPILSQFQSSIYHFVGYFSKQLQQQTPQLITNLSCLFILPSFVQQQQQQYHQCLIAYSYFLIQSNVSTSLMYSSPARPLDNITLVAFRNYWCDNLFAYIINHNHSSIKSLALDNFARQTSIHPRDILSSLYSKSFIVLHPTDKLSVYLLNNAYHSMTSLNLHMRNKFLFMDMKLINTDDEKKIIHDKPNIDKSLDSGIDEIVLD